MKGVPKEGKHEALADVYESIAELKYYRDKFIRPDAVGDRRAGGRGVDELLQPLRLRPPRDAHPDGDTLPRFVCANCDTIHYQNPKVVVGCLPEWEGRVLLCKRAIEPRHGLWTLPAGFLENGETVAAGAVRETLEEANARVDVGALYTVISLPQINQVYMMFRARLIDLDFGPGPESLEVRLFDEADIPWESLAFRTIARTLRNYFLDRKLGRSDPCVRAGAAAPAAAGPARRRVAGAGVPRRCVPVIAPVNVVKGRVKIRARTRRA